MTQMAQDYPGSAKPMPVRDGDMEEHVKTYARFVHILLWFVVHMAILLTGLYVATVVGELIGGLLLMAVGIAILIVGIGRSVIA